jgi:predicted regulator of amino acid metabolism with ACT domain
MHNEDKPGVIGKVGTQLGEAGINIINFSLGARGDGEAVAAITVDDVVDPACLAELRKIPGVVALETM